MNLSHVSKLVIVLAVGVSIGVSTGAFAQTAEEKAAAREAVWAKEQGIYANRAKGNLEYYLQNASPNYVGWPPSAARPLALTGLKEDSKRMVGLNKEILSLEFTDFTLSGGTAVIYYGTHRTMKPDGTVVDERFENIHVWTREGTDWKIVGAMSRAQPKR
jgi:hypothetical protein